MDSKKTSTIAALKKLFPNHFLLFLTGAGLSIAQFIMVRDFVTVLYGEEVVITLVVSAFFTGMSAGYLLSLKLSEKVFKILFAVSVFLHLTFPFSYRYIAAYMAHLNLGGIGFILLLFAYAFIFSTIFSAILPRFVHMEENKDTERALVEFYTSEIIGFLAGFIIVGLTWNRPLGPLLFVYWAIIGIMLLTIWRSYAIFTAYAVLAIIAGYNFSVLDKHSSSELYRVKHRVKGAEVLYSVNSPYQRVEVVRSGKGDMMLYLDGLLNLNSTDLEDLNYFLAELPAKLIKPSSTLIIGNGTLSSVSKVYPHSKKTISVELDPSVLEAGFRFYTPHEKLSAFTNWRLYNDDGKHFLKQTDENFDLIIMDIPSPLTIQEAALHTVEFYKLARERLTPNGVLAVQLSGKLRKNDRSPARITAALSVAFEDLLVLNSPRAGRGFAYASRSLPFKAKMVAKEISGYDRKTKIFEDKQVRKKLTKATAFSIDHMDIVLRRGLERFMNRYFD